jgi:hypothetical protein
MQRKALTPNDLLITEAVQKPLEYFDARYNHTARPFSVS